MRVGAIPSEPKYHLPGDNACRLHILGAPMSHHLSGSECPRQVLHGAGTRSCDLPVASFNTQTVFPAAPKRPHS